MPGAIDQTGNMAISYISFSFIDPANGTYTGSTAGCKVNFFTDGNATGFRPGEPSLSRLFSAVRMMQNAGFAAA